jgi:hypothetical protein
MNLLIRRMSATVECGCLQVCGSRVCATLGDPANPNVAAIVFRSCFPAVVKR